MHPITVFIVDDSAHVVEVLSELIEVPDRITVCGSAGTAREAIAGIARTSPDVVIADLQLREGNGFDVLDALPVGEAGASRPLIVFFSNHVAPEIRRHALARGADHFLDKTCDHGRLLELIGGQAGRHDG